MEEDKKKALNNALSALNRATTALTIQEAGGDDVRDSLRMARAASEVATGMGYLRGLY